MDIVKEPSILQFLAERVPQDPCFQQQLQGAIEESKADAGVAWVAANAISILSRLVLLSTAPTFKVSGSQVLISLMARWTRLGSKAGLKGADLSKT